MQVIDGRDTWGKFSKAKLGLIITFGSCSHCGRLLVTSQADEGILACLQVCDFHLMTCFKLVSRLGIVIYKLTVLVEHINVEVLHLSRESISLFHIISIVEFERQLSCRAARDFVFHA